MEEPSKIILLRTINSFYENWRMEISNSLKNIPVNLLRCQTSKNWTGKQRIFVFINIHEINKYVSEYIDNPHLHSMNNVNQCSHKFLYPMMTSKCWQNSRISSWSSVIPNGFALFSGWNVGPISCTCFSASLLPHLETKKSRRTQNFEVLLQLRPHGQ